jgi:hypothetical protein
MLAMGKKRAAVDRGDRGDDDDKDDNGNDEGNKYGRQDNAQGAGKRAAVDSAAGPLAVNSHAPSIAADPPLAIVATALSASKWRLDGVDMCVRNLLRHALLADVPVQAVDRVTFHAYDGPLECALVAHRLGQLPVRGLTDLSFDVRGVGPATAPLTWITAAHITGDGGRVVKGDEGATAETGAVAPAEAADAFQLVPLLAGQQVHVTCHTSLGTGRRRTTWASTFPVFTHTDERSCTLSVETTGALTPLAACIAALTAARDVYATLLHA